jgi:hypothetical protein
MERKKLASLSGVMMMFLLVSLVVYSGFEAGNSDQITHDEFVSMLIRILKLENRLPAAATVLEKMQLLEELGYAPQGGWELGRILTKGDMATVFALIMQIGVPEDAGPEDYVQALADRGIMTSGGAGNSLSLSDLTSSINTTASLPGFRASEDVPPFRLPVTPTH